MVPDLTEEGEHHVEVQRPPSPFFLGSSTQTPVSVSRVLLPPQSPGTPTRGSQVRPRETGRGCRGGLRCLLDPWGCLH